MKKYIEITVEVYNRLMNGECVEGSLKMTSKPRSINFNGWQRRAPKRYKERRIGDVDYGYLTETERHIIRKERFPKSLGLNGIQSAMNRDNKQSLGIIADMEIINFV